jgi:hypothetical protein
MANLSRHSNADKAVVANRFLDDVFGEGVAGARRFEKDAAIGTVGNLWTAQRARPSAARPMPRSTPTILKVS